MLTRDTTLYFIRAGDFVKIGRTSNLEARLVSIQTGCPFPVEAVMTFEKMGHHEREVHGRLWHHRAHGEWFHWSDAVQREIDRIAASVSSAKLALEYLTECATNGCYSPKATAIREDAKRRLPA